MDLIPTGCSEKKNAINEKEIHKHKVIYKGNTIKYGSNLKLKLAYVKLKFC